ncbi:MAG: hypothetical protein SXG53_27740 [Pseudomonadota bacterium]|nr:hypothetical protein [Pseudomonadota bacterium]
MIDLPTSAKFFSQRELALQDIQGAAAKRDLAIHPCLRAIFVYAIYDRLVDTDLACGQVAVLDGQRNLL